MQAFGFVDFVVDTHFEARGRLGRLPAALVDLKVSLGIGVD
jgi:cyanophycinase-like exopeptidase